MAARTARSLMEKLRGESLPWGTTITVQRRSAMRLDYLRLYGTFRLLRRLACIPVTIPAGVVMRG